MVWSNIHFLYYQHPIWSSLSFAGAITKKNRSKKEKMMYSSTFLLFFGRSFCNTTNDSKNGCFVNWVVIDTFETMSFWQFWRLKHPTQSHFCYVHRQIQNNHKFWKIVKKIGIYKYLHERHMYFCRICRLKKTDYSLLLIWHKFLEAKVTLCNWKYLHFHFFKRSLLKNA